MATRATTAADQQLASSSPALISIRSRPLTGVDQGLHARFFFAVQRSRNGSPPGGGFEGSRPRRLPTVPGCPAEPSTASSTVKARAWRTRCECRGRWECSSSWLPPWIRTAPTSAGYGPRRHCHGECGPPAGPSMLRGSRSSDPAAPPSSVDVYVSLDGADVLAGRLSLPQRPGRGVGDLQRRQASDWADGAPGLVSAADSFRSGGHHPIRPLDGLGRVRGRDRGGLVLRLLLELEQPRERGLKRAPGGSGRAKLGARVMVVVGLAGPAGERQADDDVLSPDSPRHAVNPALALARWARACSSGVTWPPCVATGRGAKTLRSGRRPRAALR